MATIRPSLVVLVFLISLSEASATGLSRAEVRKATKDTAEVALDLIKKRPLSKEEKLVLNSVNIKIKEKLYPNAISYEDNGNYVIEINTGVFLQSMFFTEYENVFLNYPDNKCRGYIKYLKKYFIHHKNSSSMTPDFKSALVYCNLSREYDPNFTFRDKMNGQRFLTNALSNLLLIMGHEVAHILRGDHYQPSSQEDSVDSFSKEYERKADQFARQILGKNLLLPNSLLVFTTQSERSGSENYWAVTNGCRASYFMEYIWNVSPEYRNWSPDYRSRPWKEVYSDLGRSIDGIFFKCPFERGEEVIRYFSQ